MHLKDLLSWKKLKEYIWPSMGYRRLGKYLYLKILNSFSSPIKIALGASIGSFVGMSPLLGFHNIITIIITITTRTNWVVGLIMCNVLASPIGIPLIFSADYTIGRFMLKQTEPFHFSQISNLKYLIHHFVDLFLPLLIGGFILGIVAFIVSFIFFYVAVNMYQKQRKHRRYLRKHS